MNKIHIVHVHLIAMTIRCGGTMEQRNAANMLRWNYIGAWLIGEIELPDDTLQILLEA